MSVYSVEKVQTNAWYVHAGGITRVVRYRHVHLTFAPWEVTSAEGRRLWSAATLESAFRWIQARTGQPVTALLAQALLKNSLSAETSPARISHDADHASEG